MNIKLCCKHVIFTNLNCTVDGNWSDWSTWGECSKTCGHGEGTRIRTCANPPPQHGGKDCPGVGLESMKCIGCPGEQNNVSYLDFDTVHH